MINLYQKEEIEIMKKGGKILNKIFKNLISQSKEGISGSYLNKWVEKEIKRYGANASFFGYKKFPAFLCLSLNEEIVHGVPFGKVLRKGDLVGLDLGIRFKGFCLDKAETILIGKDKKKLRFLETGKKALYQGISQAKINNHLFDISFAIQKTIENGGYSVVRTLSGHGVGREVHEEPSIPNFGQRGEGPILREGMVLAIEPMLTMGRPELELAPDGFTFRSKDRSLTCHFEETIAITKNGPVILTR